MQGRLFKTLIIVLMSGAAIYSLAGFLITPRILRYWIENSIATETGGQLAVDGVYVNPFTLSVTLTNVTLADGKNKIFLSLGRIETHLWTIEKSASGRPGRDARIHDLRFNNLSTGEALLLAPRLFVTSLVVIAEKGSVTVDSASVQSPGLHITRDSAGHTDLPAWIALPGHAFSFDTLEFSGGDIWFTDNSVSPAARTVLGDLVGTITRRPAASPSLMTAEVEGRFGDSGHGVLKAEWKPSARSAATRVNLVLRQIDLAHLSPYFARVAGRDIVTGTGDVTLRYEQHDSAVRMSNRLAIDNLRFGDSEEIESGAELPLELAVALLTDEKDHIDVTIPLLRSTVDTGGDPASLLVDGTTEYIRELTATPFEYLAKLVGVGEDQFDHLAFPPGSAEITPVTAEQITLLAEALNRRRLLRVRARPAFDPVADRDAIAAQQVRLHIDLATSAGFADRVAGAPLDFDDPKARAVLEEFANARLSTSQRNGISGRFSNNGTDYYRSVYDALVVNEAVSETGLRRLARFRAKSIIGALVNNGVDETRLLLADDVESRIEEPDAILLRLEALAGQ